VRKPITIVLPTLAASVLLAACGSSSSSSQSSSTTASQPATTASSGGSGPGTSVKSARNATLGTTILVNSQGLTLYHLTGEQNGKFICTSAECVGVWHPLTTVSGSTPSGAESLSTVKRPDGTEQVAYKGMPLYTFAQDTKEGEAKGQGIKDVGTWMAATTSASSTAAPAPAPTTTGTTTKSGGGYAY
jgi:predicted lipoprotein with Yx(FWY)xxD motif